MTSTEIFYFIYSESERKMKEKIIGRLNKKYTPARVRVNGIWKQVTSVISESQYKNYKFSDGKKIISGTLSEVTYQKGSEV